MRYFVTGATGFIGKRLVKALLARRGAVVHFLLRPESEGKVAALLDYWGGGDINNHLHINYRTYQYFFVSALGAQPDYDTATVNPGGVQPYRVEEPLLWLLRKGDVLPKIRR